MAAEVDDSGDLLASLLNRPAWHRDAACREHPELSWFPERGEDVRPVKQVCAECLVRDECLDYATKADVMPRLVGVWAGTSGRERSRLQAPAA